MGFYDEKAASGSAAIRAGWRSEIERRARFEYAIGAVGDLVQGRTVFDVGCADGALGRLVVDRGAAAYVGVDVRPEFIHIAQTQNPTGDFVCADVFDAVPPPDAIWFAIGVTVGNDGTTSLGDLYDLAARHGARAFVCCHPDAGHWDPTLHAVTPPPCLKDWTRQNGPSMHGELWWADGPPPRPVIHSQDVFDAARSCAAWLPGEAAALAARLGLVDEVRQLRDAWPADELVKLAANLVDLK